MTKEELILRLEEIHKTDEEDKEISHRQADKALLDFIDDIEVNYAYDEIDKWYA